MADIRAALNRLASPRHRILLGRRTTDEVFGAWVELTGQYDPDTGPFIGPMPGDEADPPTGHGRKGVDPSETADDALLPTETSVVALMEYVVYREGKPVRMYAGLPRGAYPVIVTKQSGTDGTNTTPHEYPYDVRELAGARSPSTAEDPFAAGAYPALTTTLIPQRQFPNGPVLSGGTFSGWFGVGLGYYAGHLNTKNQERDFVLLEVDVEPTGIRFDASGKRALSPSGYVLLTDCCGEDCYRAYRCVDDVATAIYKLPADVDTTKAYKVVGSGICVYFTAVLVSAVPTAEVLTPFAGCAECVADPAQPGDAADEECEVCDPGYHASLPPQVKVQAINVCGCDMAEALLDRNTVENCGYTDSLSWCAGMGYGTGTITYNGATCKYELQLTKEGMGGTCVGSATYEHDAFDSNDPTRTQSPTGDYELVAEDPVGAWPEALVVNLP